MRIWTHTETRHIKERAETVIEIWTNKNDVSLEMGVSKFEACEFVKKIFSATIFQRADVKAIVHLGNN